MSGFKAWGALIALIAAGSLVTACGGGADTRVRSDRDASNSATSPAPDQIPEIEVHALWALGDAKDLQLATSGLDVPFLREASTKEFRPVIEAQIKGWAASVGRRAGFAYGEEFRRVRFNGIDRWARGSDIALLDEI